MAKQTLITLEAEIESGIRSVGRSLLTIQEQRLYKEAYSDFETYCQERWNFSRQRAYQLIEAEKVKARLSTLVDKIPSNERQLREIAKVPEKEQASFVADVLEKCEAEEREPTAKDFKQAAKPFLPPKSTQVDSTPKPEPPPKAETVDCPLCDGSGHWTPEAAIPSELAKSQAFMLMWGNWLLHRKEKKAKLTPSTQAAQLAKCAEHGINRAIEVIDASIQNGWQGLFWDKEKGTKNGPVTFEAQKEANTLAALTGFMERHENE